MANYEYQVLENTSYHGDEVNMYSLTKRLNALGAQGWKVVGTGGSGAGSSHASFLQNGWIILMRELSDSKY